MSLADDIAKTIAEERCYESVNPIVRCPNAGVNKVTLINRYRAEDGRLRQSTVSAYGCKEHSS